MDVYGTSLRGLGAAKKGIKDPSPEDDQAGDIPLDGKCLKSKLFRRGRIHAHRQ